MGIRSESFNLAAGGTKQLSASNSMFIIATNGSVYIGTMRYQSLIKIAEAESDGSSRFSVTIDGTGSFIIVTNTYNTSIDYKFIRLGHG